MDIKRLKKEKRNGIQRKRVGIESYGKLKEGWEYKEKNYKSEGREYKEKNYKSEGREYKGKNYKSEGRV